MIRSSIFGLTIRLQPVDKYEFLSVYGKLLEYDTVNVKFVRYDTVQYPKKSFLC